MPPLERATSALLAEELAPNPGVVSIAAKIGCTAQTLDEWVKKAKVDSGRKLDRRSDRRPRHRRLQERPGDRDPR